MSRSRLRPVTSSCNGSNSSFLRILNLFLIFGIDFSRTSSGSRNRRRLIWFVQKFVLLCWILEILMIISYFKCSLKHVNDKNYSKMRFVRIFQVSSSFCLFCVVNRSRKRMSTAIGDVAKLRKTSTSPSSVLVWMLALAIPFYLFLFYFTVLYPYNESRYRSIFDQYTFQSFPRSSDETMFYSVPVLFNLTLILLDIFPFCFALLYAILCKHLQDLLSDYARNIEMNSLSRSQLKPASAGSKLISHVKNGWTEEGVALRLLHPHEGSLDQYLPHKVHSEPLRTFVPQTAVETDSIFPTNSQSASHSAAIRDAAKGTARNMEVSFCNQMDEYFRRYDSIVETMSRFEDATSFAILLVVARDALGILFGIVILQQDYKKAYLPFWGTVLAFTLNFRSFLLVACLASGVNECDKRTKQVHRKLLKDLLLPGGIGLLMTDKRVSFLMVMERDPPLTLTGWGFFRFTKGFLLSAIGCLFTYAFFIANL